MKSVKFWLIGMSMVLFIQKNNATEKSENFLIIGPEEAVCVDKELTLEATGTAIGYEYYWFPANAVESPYLKKTKFIPKKTTTLFVVRKKQSNPNLSDTAYITVRVLEHKLQIYGPDFVCLGTSAELEISPNMKNPKWSNNKATHAISITQPGVYSVEAFDGCFLAKGSHYVSSKTEPVSRIMTSRSTDLCAGESVKLTSFSSMNPIWSNGSKSKSIVVSEQDVFTLTNSNECGIDKSSIEVNVIPILADFIPSSVELKVSELLSLYNHSKNGERFEWYEDGILFSRERNAEVRFQQEGVREIELHAYNSNGCKDIMKYPNITVMSHEATLSSSKQDILFPNSFTPNGDGRNDALIIYAGDIQSLEVTIFNRWGQDVFQESQLSQIEWAGTDQNGTALEAGQYILQYSYVNRFGDRVSNTAPINLMR